MAITLDGTSGITATGSLTGLTTAISAGQGGTGLTSVGTAGNVLTSNGTAWVSSAPASGSITLLGTVTATSGNSVSLGSLTLTGYKELHIVSSSVSHSAASGAVCYVSSDNSQTLNYYFFYIRNAQINSGIGIINLSTGSFMASSSQDTDPGNGVPIAGKTNITTATTTIYFRLASTAAFSAGSFLVYGVA